MIILKWWGLFAPENGGLFAPKKWGLFQAVKGGLLRRNFQLTSSGIESSELESFKLGADDFISKPFSPAVMKTRINKLLGTNA